VLAEDGGHILGVTPLTVGGTAAPTGSTDAGIRVNQVSGCALPGVQAELSLTTGFLGVDRGRFRPVADFELAVDALEVLADGPGLMKSGWAIAGLVSPPPGSPGTFEAEIPEGVQHHEVTVPGNGGTWLAEHSQPCP
jgi:hypothetical protein